MSGIGLVYLTGGARDNRRVSGSVGRRREYVDGGVASAGGAGGQGCDERKDLDSC